MNAPPSRPLLGRPDQVHFPRAMFLYALGALVGLAIAGYGLFTAQGTAVRGVPPEDVALVNQRPVLRSDFITQLESETGLKFEQAPRAEQLRVLAEMVNEELLVQRGLELDFAETDQDTRNALVTIVNQQMTADVAISTPTEAELRAWYDAHRASYATEGQMTVCHLVAKPAAAAAAAEAVRLLRAGQPAAAVAARTGLADANQCEQNFWFAQKIHLGAALFAAAQPLAGGSVAGPVADAGGLHVLQVLQNAPPVPMSFEVAHDQVESDFKRAREARIVAATMKFLRERARIEITPEYSGDYKP